MVQLDACVVRKQNAARNMRAMAWTNVGSLYKHVSNCDERGMQFQSENERMKFFTRFERILKTALDIKYHVFHLTLPKRALCVVFIKIQTTLFFL